MRSKLLILTLFLLSFSIVNAEETNSATNELLHESENPKIIIPDIKLSIEDESKVPLANQNESIIQGHPSNEVGIDIDELNKVKESDKFKAEMTKQMTNENFSLASFKAYYGSYNNIIAEINAGNKSDNFNYIVTYLRNTRDDIGYQNATYFNTSMSIDDLNGDLTYSVNSNLDITGSFGYYARSIGLYTNISNVIETKKNVPFSLGDIYEISMNTILKTEGYYNYLDLNHQLSSGYNDKILQDIGLNADLETDWGRDNFLKLSGKYLYSDYNGDFLQFGRAGGIIKFPFGNLALQGGSEFDVYNYKGLFWAPNLMLFYKYSSLISMKGGIYGEQSNLSINRLVDENQIDYNFTMPEEKWVYLYSIQFSPLDFINLRGNVSLDQYFSYLNYNYEPSTDLYYLASITNVNVLNMEVILELIAFDNFIIDASYIYKLPSENDLFFFSINSVSLSVEYNITNIGFSALTKLTYKDSQEYQPGAYLPSAWIWDVSFSLGLSKNIFIELLLKNILNQVNFDMPDVPEGGITINAGIRILL